MFLIFATAKAKRTIATQLFPLAQLYMKRLSLEELKVQAAQKDQLTQNVKVNLEAIKGGDVDWCHVAEVLKKVEKFIFF